MAAQKTPRDELIPSPMPARMTREEAIAAAERGIGSRPDLPPGEVWVRQLRKKMWSSTAGRA